MCKNNHMSRRDVIQNIAQYSALAGVAALSGSQAFALPRMPLASGSPNDPHFFLHINLPNGVDASYLFDARPLAMTDAGLIANYHGKEPLLYNGINGQSTLRTTITDPLMKHKDRFSIINGVVMSPTLDGHDQLMNMLLTGNPFGGETFLPWTSQQPMPMDYVSSAFMYTSITNSGASMVLSPDKTRMLAKKIARIGGNTRMNQFIQGRSHEVGTKKSSLAASARRLETSSLALGDFSHKMASMNIPENDASESDSDDVKFLKKVHADTAMLTEFMRVGLTNACVLVINDSIDSHDAQSARSLPKIFANYCAAIAATFDYLASVPSPSGRSMLDDTTFLIGSEFSRTMRQPGVDIKKTGTDHNPLTNTLIVGGKGVRGGMVVGQSDFATANEVLSPAHLTADPQRLKIMGRPFDVESGQVITAPLASFDVKQYIGASNVTNTIQDILGIPTKRRFIYGQSMPVAASIKALIG